ncbi:unnamed protein product [Adineta steineri]|uniref:FAD-binding PCMH-type domain-containing protein n=1 Tax=Adineta steineri TaxID=433720 RepID=A0A819E8N5_9BILA|nr:unnamed protein product [Adineta steineri]CAF3846191.1 unnamed protein product [Adineta steineri]
MIKFDLNQFFILSIYIVRIRFTTTDHLSTSRISEPNNNKLHKCLSLSLPLSTRIIYPCNTLTNQNSFQYRCTHFNVSSLSSILGGRISHSPAVIIYPSDSSDVQNIVKCATKLNYIVNALGGGHSYEGYGLGSVYNNIIINMERINYIHINQHDRIGTFGAGARLGPIYYRAYQHGKLTINGGSCPWVGLAGHALGGGFGFLARLHGLLSDNIIEMKAVNAQGELLTINETHEPELYWALRGGGGGLFVIVTEFKFRLIKSPSVVTTFLSMWNTNATKYVIQRYQSLIFNNKTLNLNKSIFMEMFVNKTHVQILIINFDIDLTEFNKTILLFLKGLPTSNNISFDKQDWLTFVYKHSGLDNLNSDHRHLLLENLTLPTYNFKGKHLFYNQSIANHSLDLVIHRLALADGNISMLFNPWDGYLSEIPVNKTAFPHRNFKFGIQFMNYWIDRQQEEKQMNLLNQIYLCLYNDSTKYSYINYIDRTEDNWMNVYYNTHQQRLISIKNIYDKKNRFAFERTIQINQKKTTYSFTIFLLLMFFV